EGLHPFLGPNFTEVRARFVLFGPDSRRLGEIVSAKRLSTARGMTTTEASNRTIGLSQLYGSIGDVTSGGGMVVRLWWKTLVTLIWIGALVMTGGGIISLCDRRLRVGVPVRRRQEVRSAGGDR